MTDSGPGDDTFPVHARVRHAEHGLGVVLEADRRTITVAFDHGADSLRLNPRTAMITRLRWEVGDPVQLVGPDAAATVRRVAQSGDLFRYTVEMAASGERRVVPEQDLAPREIVRSPDELLAAGDFDHSRNFFFRTTAHDLRAVRQLVGVSGTIARIVPRPHQMFVAQRVLRAPSARFLLADEVGLGKTIEAGLIIQELRARGSLDHVLVITPTNLAIQWLQEMRTKFNERFVLLDTPSRLDDARARAPTANPWDVNRAVISTHTFVTRNKAHWDELLAVPWDLVIVDEAHHARRALDGKGSWEATQLYRFLQDLSRRTRGLLLLTATPMQLDPSELFSLVELIDPALFYSNEAFVERTKRNRHVNDLVGRVTRFAELAPQDQYETVRDILSDSALEVRTDDLTELASSTLARERVIEQLSEQHMLSQVMIRNRKRLVGGFTRRRPSILRVPFSAAERALYDELGRFTRELYLAANARQRFVTGFMLVGYQRRLTSSLVAFTRTVERRMEKVRAGSTGGTASYLTAEDVATGDLDDLGQQAIEVSLSPGSESTELTSLRHLLVLAGRIRTDAKLARLRSFLQELDVDAHGEQVVIFTQYFDTLDYLVKALAADATVVAFHGGLKAADKDRAIATFVRGEARILVTTEAGGEGRNLQTCSVLVNYDLPWNPMKVEQRIGRLDRIGQQRDVLIVNFALEGTVEERVLDVLDRRIHAFEETIGGLDPILGDLEGNLQRIVLETGNDDDRQARAINELADRLAADVDRARRADEIQRDFVMDRRSFDHRLHEEFDEATRRRIEKNGNVFARRMLDALGTGMTRIHDETYRLRFGGRFQLALPPGVSETATMTFSRRQALEDETVEFGSLGHPIFDMLVDAWSQPLFQKIGLTARRVISSPDHLPFEGFQFNFMVTVRGARDTSRLVPVAVDLNDTVRLELADLLLERHDWRDTPPGQDLARYGQAWPEMVRRAFEQAEDWVVATMDREMTTRRADAAAQRAGERQKVLRYADHRATEARRKIDNCVAILNRLESSDRAQDRQVVPIWRRTLETAEERAREVDLERRERLAEIDARQQETYSTQLVNAAWVEVVTPADA
ncbi:MAG TPA: helicase-related protein [Thermomicrobiales bacterium]|jgi:SNF2 family DNA or RNA helicase|nr:helicase-related protein [Thermomicrobiales bacterium]